MSRHFPDRLGFFQEGSTMDRRNFTSGLAAGAAVSLFPHLVRAQSAAYARNVVLVHGLFADGSCWSEVISRLQSAGLNATAVQNPLTALDAAVASTQRVLARQDGATVLVGHSFGGMILSEAGVDPKVSALVYVAARAPDAGEDYGALAAKYPTPPASAGIRAAAHPPPPPPPPPPAGLVGEGGGGRVGELFFLFFFAGDLPADKAR